MVRLAFIAYENCVLKHSFGFKIGTVETNMQLCARDFPGRVIFRLLHLQSLGPEVVLGRQKTPASAVWSWQYFYPAKGGHRETWRAPQCFHNLQTRGRHKS